MDHEFNIVDFPREIIEHIFSFIDNTQGYTSFRQTCWYIYHCSQFIKHFYPSGTLRLRVPIKKHNINGHVIGYHYNDALKYVGLYINSEKEGIHKFEFVELNRIVTFLWILPKMRLVFSFECSSMHGIFWSLSKNWNRSFFWLQCLL